MVWDCVFFQLSDMGKGQRASKKTVCVVLFVAELQYSYGSSTKVMHFSLKARTEAVLCAHDLLLQVLFFVEGICGQC